MQSYLLYPFLVLVLVGSHVSWAQTYRYRTPDGRWMFSNTPPADGAEIVTTKPAGSGPSMQSTVQVPRLKPTKHSKKRRHHKTANRHHRSRRRHTQRPRAVNTHQFGLLKMGSSKAAILHLLGPPAEKVREGQKKRMVHLNGRYIERKVKIETWYYPGSSRLRPTRLVFYNDLLGEKDKGGY